MKPGKKFQIIILQGLKGRHPLAMGIAHGEIIIPLPRPEGLTSNSDGHTQCKEENSKKKLHLKLEIFKEYQAVGIAA